MIKKNSGFNLLELIIVIIILGVIATFALPNFTKRIKKQKVQTTAQEIANVINLARSDAFDQGKPMIIQPTLFRKDGKLNGNRRPWDGKGEELKPNGLFTFTFKENYAPESNVFEYNNEIHDSVRELPWSSNLELQAETYRKDEEGKIEKSEEFPTLFVIFPDKKLHFVASKENVSENNLESGYKARIIVKYEDSNICSVVRLEENSKAEVCTSKEMSDKNSKNYQVCNCKNIEDDGKDEE